MGRVRRIAIIAAPAVRAEMTLASNSSERLPSAPSGVRDSPARSLTTAPLSTWFLRCAFALCVAGYVFVYATQRADNPIRSDGFSYYVYLPSWFLFHDTTLSALAHDCCGGAYPTYTAIIRWPSTR